MEIKNHNIIKKFLSAWILAILVVGFLFFYFYQPAIAPERHDKIFCTMEAKLCPDGSYVGRTGPNCEFETCPKQGLGQEDVSTWKTYRNEKYGFEVKYPSSWNITTRGSGEAIPATKTASSFFVGDNPGVSGASFLIAGFGLESIGSYFKSATNVNEYLNLLSKNIGKIDVNRNIVDANGNIIYRFIKETTISERNALQFKVTPEFKDRVYFQDLNNLYEISWYNKLGKLDDRLFDQILSTFKFLK